MLVYRGVGSKFSPVAVGLVLKWGFEGPMLSYFPGNEFTRQWPIWQLCKNISVFFFRPGVLIKKWPNGKSEGFLGTLGTLYSLRLSPHVLPGLNVSSVSSLDGTCQYFVMHLWLCLDVVCYCLLEISEMGFRRTLERVNMQQLFQSGYCFALGCRQSLWRSCHDSSSGGPKELLPP